jgi:hypothetical protein
MKEIFNGSKQASCILKYLLLATIISTSAQALQTPLAQADSTLAGADNQIGDVDHQTTHRIVPPQRNSFTGHRPSQTSTKP